MNVIFASITFQILWFVAVLGRENGQWLLLAAVVVLWFLLYRKLTQGALSLVLFALLGVVIDSLNLRFGVLAFGQSLLPLWMIALWFLFTWYLACLSSTLSRFPPYLVSIAFMVGGASSYLVAIGLSAATTQYSTFTTLTVLSSEWLFLGVIAIRVVGHVETYGSIRSDSSRDSV